jgi:DNA transformation protein
MASAEHAFAEALHDVFARFGRIRLQRMFGGHALMHDDRMFAFTTRGRLYFKTDAQTVPAFEARGLGPFEYMRQGRLARLHFHEAPPEVFEDPDEAARWARQAWEVVLRAPAAGRARKSPARQAAGPR